MPRCVLGGGGGVGALVGRARRGSRTGGERRTPLQAGDHQRGDQDDADEQRARPLRGVGQAEAGRPGAEQQHRDQGAAGVEPAVLELGGARGRRPRSPGAGTACRPSASRRRGSRRARCPRRPPAPRTSRAPRNCSRRTLTPASRAASGLKPDGVEAPPGGGVLEQVPDADRDDGDVEHGQDEPRDVVCPILEKPPASFTSLIGVSLVTSVISAWISEPVARVAMKESIFMPTTTVALIRPTARPISTPSADRQRRAARRRRRSGRRRPRRGSC